MSDLQKQMQERIESFVEEISELVRQAALEAVSEALGGTDGLASLVQGRGRRATGSLVSVLRRRGGKRSPQEIESTTKIVIDFITRNPGQGVEQMAKALGRDTKELTLPIRKLVAARQLVTEGQKRATKYYPATADSGESNRKPRSARARKARRRRPG